MSFGDVIRSGNSPSTIPGGVGGNASTIWHCDSNTDDIYELNVSDFSVASSANSPGASPFGIGGTDTTIWHNNYSAGNVYELKTSDFSVIRSAGTPSVNPSGTGGDDSTIWHCDYSFDTVYELSTSDFSVIRSLNNRAIDAEIVGIGGDSNTIWLCETKKYVSELSTTDLSKVKNAASPSTWPTGVGGNSGILWCCDRDSDKIYELDGDKVFTLSGTISDEFGNPICDAAITISNGTIYTTTSDKNGAYSKTVNSDTYDIAVSKPRSRFHNITESSVSVSADTTKNITMLTDKCLSGLGATGMSILGGTSLGRSRK